VGPHGLAPVDLEQVFRRVHFLDGDFDAGAVGMAYPQVSDISSAGSHFCMARHTSACKVTL
jgi:hypothetical protein